MGKRVGKIFKSSLWQTFAEILTKEKVSLVVSLLVDTIAFGFLLIWLKTLAFPSSIEEKASAYEWWLFITLFLIWIFLYFKLRGLKDIALNLPRMDLRQILIHMRRLEVQTTQRINKISTEFEVKSKEDLSNALEGALDFDKTVTDLLERIWLSFSGSNSDLRRHFRAVLWQPMKEGLTITHWANSEMERPKSASLGKKLNKGEGCAGMAWSYMKPFIVSDLEDYRHSVNLGEAEPNRFIDLHEEQEKIKSIVSIPVIIREPSQENLVGIVSVDTDIAGYFTESEDGESQIRIRSYPIIRGIALAFQIKNFIQLTK